MASEPPNFECKNTCSMLLPGSLLSSFMHLCVDALVFATSMEETCRSPCHFPRRVAPWMKRRIRGSSMEWFDHMFPC